MSVTMRLLVFILTLLAFNPNRLLAQDWEDYPEGERFAPSGAVSDFSLLTHLGRFLEAIDEVKPRWAADVVAFPLRIDEETVYKTERELINALADPEAPFVFKARPREGRAASRNKLRKSALSISGLTVIELPSGVRISTELVSRIGSRKARALERVRGDHPGDGALVNVRFRLATGPQTDNCTDDGLLIYIVPIDHEWRVVWLDA